MIDIHSHIVFDVDDGPKTREDTRALLEESYRQGVRTIISTSHRRKGMFETPEEKISKNFQEVKKIAAEVAPDLTIHYGAEIYFTNDVLKKLEEKIIPRLAETRFALIEFSMGTPYKEIHTALLFKNLFQSHFYFLITVQFSSCIIFCNVLDILFVVSNLILDMAFPRSTALAKATNS